jgi:hypothetical protein
MWIIPQHHKQIDRFYDILSLIKRANDNNLSNIRNGIITELKNGGKYNGGKKESISSANHNIDEPFFYGLIYKFQNKVFISKYGELIYKFWGDFEKRRIIFIFCLFNIQYFNPAKKLCEARLFPYRLLFKVLIDKRIEYKISTTELFFFYNYIKLTNNTVEEIISQILHFRKINIEEKISFLQKNSDIFVKSYVSASYSFIILQKFGIFNDKTESDFSFKFKSDKRKEETSITDKTFYINSDIQNVIVEILKLYPENENVRDSELPSDLISEIYNFVSPKLWDYLGSDTRIDYDEKLKLPNLIYEYSINPNTWDKFEDVISDSFNQFYNIKAERVSGAGETDVVAKYKPNFPDDFGYKIFTADAKSTKNSLSYINSGRLDSHREKFNGEFTIVVTPKYVPAVKKDILGRKIVIISSLALSELSKNVLNSDNNDFTPIFNLISNNLGEDISSKIYSLIEEEYGVLV